MLFYNIAHIAVLVCLPDGVDKVHEENGAEEGTQHDTGDSAIRDARAGCYRRRGGLARRQDVGGWDVLRYVSLQPARSAKVGNATISSTACKWRLRKKCRRLIEAYSCLASRCMRKSVLRLKSKSRPAYWIKSWSALPCICTTHTAALATRQRNRNRDEVVAGRQLGATQPCDVIRKRATLFWTSCLGPRLLGAKAGQRSRALL